VKCCEIAAQLPQAENYSQNYRKNYRKSRSKNVVGKPTCTYASTTNDVGKPTC
jgi:hypothetical protein